MKSKARKIIIRALVIIIGLPVALILTAYACVFIMDKTNGTIVSSGMTRRYLLYVPKTYDPSKPTPLLISMHPGGAWPAAEMHISGWNEIAEQHGFIVVYPAGSGAFSGGSSRGPHSFHMGPRSLGREVRFISDLINKLETEYNVDPTRIYADGMSNGGGMAFALSCRLFDRIAAVGSVAGAQTLDWESCADSKPVPTVAFHGTADPLAPYDGGTSPISPGLFPSIRDWAARVARRNQCKGEPSDTRVTTSVRRLAYTNCAENADVVLYTIEGGEPLPEWMAGRTSREINASSVMWEFFVQHRRGSK